MKRKHFYKVSFDHSLPQVSQGLKAAIQREGSIKLFRLNKLSFKITSTEEMGSYINGPRHKFYITTNLKSINKKTQITYRDKANDIFGLLSVVVPLQGLLMPFIFLMSGSENAVSTNLALIGAYILITVLFINYMNSISNKYKDKAKTTFDDVLMKTKADMSLQ